MISKTTMFKTTLSAFLIVHGFHLFGMANKLITLPSALVLEQRICQTDSNLKEFLQKTQLLKNLGGQKKSSVEIIYEVEVALKKYARHSKNTLQSSLAELTKPLIIQAISEEAYNEAASKGLFKHKEK